MHMIKSLKQYIDLSKLILLICGLLLIVCPITYAKGGWSSVSFSVIFALIIAYFFKHDVLRSLSITLVASFFTNSSLSISDSLLIGSIIGLLTGFLITIFRKAEFGSKSVLMLFLVGCILGVGLGCVILYNRGWAYLPQVFSLTVSAGLGVLLGGLLGSWLQPKLLAFSNVWFYLREMAPHLVVFMVGYLLIALLFAGWYWAVWKLNPSSSFNNLSSKPFFGEFYYFSMTTITTVGYGDISPKSDLARCLTAGETIAGIGWVTVTFAAVVSHLQPRFAEIAKAVEEVEQRRQRAYIQ